MRHPKLVLSIGLLLLLPSFYTVFLIGREVWLQQIAQNRYRIDEMFSPSTGPTQEWIPLHYEWHGQRVVLTDDFEKGTYETDARRAGEVKIIINGRDYSLPEMVEVRPTDHDSNRYWMQVMLIKITDLKSRRERLAVVQSYPDYNLHPYYELHSDALMCRAVFLDSDGKVAEERFRFSDRNRPLYRTLLANEVSPEALGFYSNLLEWWPTIFFPFLYPGVTLIFGLIMTLSSGVSISRARRQEMAVFESGRRVLLETHIRERRNARQPWHRIAVFIVGHSRFDFAAFNGDNQRRFLLGDAQRCNGAPHRVDFRLARLLGEIIHDSNY